MSTQIQRRRGTTAEHSTFTGVEGELTVDTTKDTAVVHDGTTVGGHPLQKQYPPLGSAAAPTYTFTGDTNTGIYSPGADQVAVSTGGTGRLFVDASGNVGVGTSSISTFGGYTTLEINNGASGAILDLSQGDVMRGRFVAGTASATIETSGSIPLLLSPGGTEKLRVTSGGLVGIGTSSVSELLTVAGNARFDKASSDLFIKIGGTSRGGNTYSNYIDLDNNGFGAPGAFQTASKGDKIILWGGSSNDAEARIGFSLDDSVWVKTMGTAVPNAFAVHGAAANSGSPNRLFTITKTGLVGIGTTSPTNTLQVGATTSASSTSPVSISLGGQYTPDASISLSNLKLKVYDTGSNSAGFTAGQNNGLCYVAPTTGPHTWYTTDGAGTLSERMRITSGGNVGIGTTAPSAQLHVRDSANYNFTVAAGNSTTGMQIGNYDATDGYNPLTFRGSQYLFTSTGGNERARIDSSGRLLVGTSSGRAVGFSTLQAPVQVETTTAAAYTAVNNTNDANGCYVSIAKTRGTSAGAVTAVQNNDELGAIRISGSDGTGFVVGAQIIAAVDGTPGTNDLPTRLMFSTTADGGSSPTERMRIASNGQIGSFAADGSPSYTIRNATGAGTATVFIQGLYSATGTTSGGTASVYVFTNGNIQNTNNSYGAISDIKLKENIVDANSQWDDLKALQVRNYNFKEGQTHTQIGLVAQEAELVSPGLVSESPDRDEDGNDLGTVTKSVNYSVLYMKAVKALQEAMERIETLEGMVAVNNITIDEQQHQLSTLAARLTALETP
jgi:hypothetical protein